MGLLPAGGSDMDGGQAAAAADRGFSLKEAARTKQFWIICIAEFTVLCCLLTIVVHIVPYARDLGLAPAYAAGVLSTIGGVSILGRIVMGAANDRIGGRAALIICLIVLFCSFVWLQLATEVWMLFLFAVIYGFAHGGFFTVVSPMVAELFGTGSHGLLFGIILFSGTLGGAVGPLMAGWTFDVTGSYRLVFLVLSVLTLIGFVLLMLLRPIGARETGS
jgi:MFS family permease